MDTFPQKVTEGKITRRMHPHDLRNLNRISSTPSLNNVYQSWGSLSSYEHVHSKSDMIPIGGTKTLRSFQSETFLDPTNLYQVTKTPGPGAYDNNLYLSFGSTLPKRSLKAGTMSTARRDCLMKVSAIHKFPERQTLSPRPGPGDYDPARPRSPTLIGSKSILCKGEQQKIRLAQVEHQIRRTKEKLKGYDKLHDQVEKKAFLCNQTTNELKRLQAEHKALKKGLDRLGQLSVADSHRHDLPFPTPSESIAGTFPFNSTTSNRFYHPLIDTKTSVSTPAPGAHEIHPIISKFGAETLHQATTLGWGHRSTDPDAPEKHRFEEMRLTKAGDIYFIRPEILGPGDYTPPLFSPSKKNANKHNS